MGTINYGSNDYVTIGIKPYDMEELKEIFPDHTEEEIYYFTPELYSEHMEEIQDIIDKYYFEHFTLKLNPGYYEGFYMLIENENYYGFYDSEEKEDAINELPQLKECLLKCIEYGLCVVYPGWCTAYLDVSESWKEIDDTIKQLKEEFQKAEVDVL